MLSHEVTTEKSNPAIDVEKSASTSSVSGEVVEGNSEELGDRKSFWAPLANRGVEIRGALPVSPENRIDTRFFNVFTVFLTSMLSLLPLVSF
jgi:hypothetical protein